MKTVIKEIFIILLLLGTIGLILAVMFYDYFPTNKNVPEAFSYSMPEELSEVNEELSNMIANENQEKVNITLNVTEEDLAGFKQTKTYEAGKADPFAEYAEEPAQTNETTNSTTENSNATSSNSNSSQNSTKNNNTNSTGRIFEKGNSK